MVNFVNLNSFTGLFGVAQQKMDQEIKERDERYSELDSKLNRLHKRAKQRIQEVQKVILPIFLMMVNYKFVLLSRNTLLPLLLGFFTLPQRTHVGLFILH